MKVNSEYRARSPIFHLERVGNLPLEICAGVRDGHMGSVPIQHSLRAFNVVAKAAGQPLVSDAEIEQLWQNQRLVAPRDSDQGTDPAFGREIRLRRTAGPARITIFDGQHEGLPYAAAEWLAGHSRATKAAESDGHQR